MIDKFIGEFDFLSNFYPAPLSVTETIWPTSEHLYQAEKSLDPAERETIRLVHTPGRTKHLGRKVRLQPSWGIVKEITMYNIVLRKFTQHSDLARRLAETEDRTLIEENTWHDNFWGNCICPRCDSKAGKNKLGKILMRIRKELKEKYAEPQSRKL